MWTKLTIRRYRSQQTLQNVENLLNTNAQASWEIGVQVQSLLEFSFPSLSVFNGPLPSSFQVASSLKNIANDIMQNYTFQNLPSPQPLMANSLVGDAASVGTLLLMLNQSGDTSWNYPGACQSQLEYLLKEVPRSDQGAISHNAAEVQLW